MDYEQVLTEIAVHLPGWKLDKRNPHRPLFVNGSGQMILIEVNSYQHTGKFRFTACAPRCNRINWYGFRDPDGKSVRSPAIGTSKQRAPKAIARDIVRRLLPHYSELWRSTQAAIRDNIEALEMTDNIEQLLIKSVKGHRRNSGYMKQSRELRRVIDFGDSSVPTGRGTVTYYGYTDEHVEISLNDLTLDFAIKLLNIYKKEIETYGRQESTAPT